jgi:hypothetical protein
MSPQDSRNDARDSAKRTTALEVCGRDSIKESCLTRSSRSGGTLRCAGFGSVDRPYYARTNMAAAPRNHALVDGNKRMAWAPTTLFLLFNDIEIKVPGVDAAEDFVVGVAQGSTRAHRDARTSEVVGSADRAEDFSRPIEISREIRRCAHPGSGRRWDGRTRHASPIG